MSTDPTLPQALRSGELTEIILVKIEHPDDDVFLWNGLGNLEADVGDGVQTFKGLGRLGNLSIGPSDAEVQVTDVVFTLSGIDEEHLSYLDATVKGLQAKAWKGFLGADFKVRFIELIAECALDQPSFATDPNGQSTMTVTANGGFYFLDVQSSSVWDVEEQKNFLVSLGEDPDSDTGFDLMSELKNLQITWERPS